MPDLSPQLLSAIALIWSIGNTVAIWLRKLGRDTRHADYIDTDLAWLVEHGFVEVEQRAGVMVVTLTARGQDAVSGCATHPGV